MWFLVGIMVFFLFPRERFQRLLAIDMMTLMVLSLSKVHIHAPHMNRLSYSVVPTLYLLKTQSVDM